MNNSRIKNKRLNVIESLKAFLSHVSRVLSISYRRAKKLEIKKWSQSRTQAHKTRSKTASSETALRCITSRVEVSPDDHSSTISSFLSVSDRLAITKGRPKFSIPLLPTILNSLLFLGETFEVCRNTSRDIARDYFLCKSEVCFPADGPSRLQKSIFQGYALWRHSFTLFAKFILCTLRE